VAVYEYEASREPVHELSPLARIQWSAVVAGVFTTLALFTISAILARAVGVWWTYRTAQTTGEEVASVIWGCVTALVAFWVGGVVAVRLSARGLRSANALMVWAVAIPALVLLMGAGFGPMLGRAAEQPIQPQQRIFGTTEGIEPGQVIVTSRGHAQAGAWWALASLACGIVGVLAAAGTTPPTLTRTTRAPIG
jgi:hypothetical protein